MISAETVARSGLAAIWAVRFPALRDPRRRELAVRHVADILRELAVPYRLGFAMYLRLLSVLPGHGRSMWWTRLPGAGQVYRVTTTLALYGALESGEVR